MSIHFLRFASFENPGWPFSAWMRTVSWLANRTTEQERGNCKQDTNAETKDKILSEILMKIPSKTVENWYQVIHEAFRVIMNAEVDVRESRFESKMMKQDFMQGMNFKA